MADRKPPRLCADERETLLELLQFQRESMLRKVEGLSDTDAERRLVESDTTLLWLVQHLAHAERLWVLVRFAGQEPSVVEPPDGDGSLAAAAEHYRQTWTDVGDVIARASLDDVGADDQGLEPVNLRWVLAHLLEETARHAGHADILREQIDGQIGR
ncbi:MAG: DUF664 domain-containing protein [Frankiales bacterium]|nr:DUF664 domain-containing protein [Frankiales bacterium]